jgi:hypothetical protein
MENETIHYQYSENELVDRTYETEENVETEKQNNTINPKNEKNKGNKRVINKMKRRLGKSYIGYSKPRNQRNTFHNAQRDERKMGDRCKCKAAYYKCNEFSDIRTETFTNL